MDVELRYEKIMREMTLDEFRNHLQVSSLSYSQIVRHPIDSPSYIVVTPVSTDHKERYFLRNHTQFTLKF